MADHIPRLSEPLTLPCGLEVPNRLAKAAMAEQMASGDQSVPSEKFANVYSQWSDGGWGMILTGNVHVDPLHLGSPNDLTLDYARLDDPEYIAAWAKYAEASQKNGSPTIVQICHPGRQSPAGAGRRAFMDKTVAPSAVPLVLGSGLLAKVVRSLVFGTPRELSTEEVGGIVDKFVQTSVHMYKSGFKGIEIHAAHGYLLAQFLSPKTNLRTDKFGGSPAKRAAIVVEIINGIRKATPATFCVGIKLNSADVQAGESLEDTMEQIKLITQAGIDFMEISGGTYEKTRMMDGDVETQKSERTQKREAFFLDFAQEVRQNFPKTVLMVTGGFRSRAGMADALASGACELVGIGRPAAIFPRLPAETILNEKVSSEEAIAVLNPPKKPTLLNALGLGFVGAGIETTFYSAKIQAFSLLSSLTKKTI